MKIVMGIGGSILMKEFDRKGFEDYADVLSSLYDEHELYIVVGGGKPAREYIGVARGLGTSESNCDDIGIDVTRLNARLLIMALGDIAYPMVPHNFREAQAAGATGKIVVMGGTEPAHSTDAVGAILAETIQADLYINLTSVDGLYDKDPNKFQDAKFFTKISPDEAINLVKDKEVKAGTYEIFDMTALQMIKRSGLETVIVNGYDSKNILRVLDGEDIGTRITQ